MYLSCYKPPYEIRKNDFSELAVAAVNRRIELMRKGKGRCDLEMSLSVGVLSDEIIGHAFSTKEQWAKFFIRRFDTIIEVMPGTRRHFPKLFDRLQRVKQSAHNLLAKAYEKNGIPA